MTAPRINDSVVVRTLASVGEFSDLATEWDALVRAMPRPSPFLLQGWIGPWWKHYGDDCALEVHAAFSDGRLIGAVPLCVERRMGLRILRFAGGPDASLGDVLVAPGHDAVPVARSLMEHARRRHRHDLAALYGMPAHNCLQRSVAPGQLRLIERNEAPVLEAPDGWEAVYRANTSSKTRNTHKRRRRQLAELGHLETRVVSASEDLESVLEDALRLHRLRWEGRPDASDFASERGAAFQREALLTLAEDDIPRLVMLVLDGRAIAFHAYLKLGDRMYVYRLAFDPALSRYSPGLVNTYDALAAGIGEGAKRVEFLGGAERYKRELATRFEPLYVGLGLTTTPQGHAAAVAIAGAIRARKRLKRSQRLRRFYFETLAPLRRRLDGLGGR
jgi:CelD/BcsL family acetyltransferase involved in cellulose biosynthesis